MACLAVLRGGLLVVPVGAKGSFWPEVSVFEAVGELVGFVFSRELTAIVPRIPGFILLGRVSDTLLVISILVYDCHF